MNVTTISTEYLSEHRYFRARRDAYRLESGKEVDPYFVVEMPDAAMAMGVTMDGDVILIRQYRHAIGRLSLELPGGFIDSGEDPEAAVRRELLEETGHSFGELKFLGTTYSNPGVLCNATHMYLVTGGKRVGDQVLDGNEEIEILFKPISEVKELLKSDGFLQSMHALLLYKAFEILDDRNGHHPG